MNVEKKVWFNGTIYLTNWPWISDFIIWGTDGSPRSISHTFGLKMAPSPCGYVSDFWLFPFDVWVDKHWVPMIPQFYLDAQTKFLKGKEMKDCDAKIYRWKHVIPWKI
jgi:hypothetical protein